MRLLSMAAELTTMWPSLVRLEAGQLQEAVVGGAPPSEESVALPGTLPGGARRRTPESQGPPG